MTPNFPMRLRVAGTVLFVAFGVSIALWTYTLRTWLAEPLAIYQVVGPPEDYFWGAAQFEVAGSRLQVQLYRYASGDDDALVDLADRYTILKSKLSRLTAPSEATWTARQTPDYEESLQAIDAIFKQTDPLISLLPKNRKIALEIAKKMEGLDKLDYRLAQSIGVAGSYQRDRILHDSLRKRRAFYLISGISGLLALALLAGFIFQLRQLDRRARQENALRIAERDAKIAAKKAVQAKNAFLGAIGHELRTPLQTITSAIDVLAGRELSARDMKTIFRLEEAVQQMDSQMRDLADYSRLDSGKLTIRVRRFNVADLVAGMVDGAAQEARKKGLVVRLDATGNDFDVYSDPDRIRQIVTNLLSNAIKYADNGTVVVRVTLAERLANVSKLLTIAVEDPGCGIPADKINSIFEPFIQADEGNTRRHDGIGMGLAIVKGLVQLLAGDVQVHSVVGKGSSFVVALPVEQRSPNDDMGRPGRTGFLEFGDQRERRVLVVDDHESVRESFAGLLAGMGVAFDLSDNAESALRLLREIRYDALLLDIQMPEIDGVTLARELRNTPGWSTEIPIIGVSAYAPELLEAGQAEMFFDYLMKPVRDETLRSVLVRATREGYKS